MSGFEGAQAFPIDVDGEDLNIGIVVAQFNQEIGEAMLDACYSELLRLDVSAENVAIASVPGALEIPITLQRFADSGRFDALIALGAVIRGETYHFEIVSNESASGIMAVQLDSGVPVANGILTCNTEEQVLARVEQKSIDCAQVAVQMARLMEAIDEG
ncbi:MAG: 6,7-dimethyl-8-ribityllumazine synthase [Betaproteobacteria bacterium]|nr:MAG: 6,7-dimethyl-8-ribityllumazine synthase [Betaproteobacteria bacterium]